MRREIILNQGVGRVLNAITCTHIEGGRGRSDRERDRERRGCTDGAERDVKRLALKSGVMRPQAQEAWQPAEAGAGREQLLP